VKSGRILSYLGRIPPCYLKRVHPRFCMPSMRIYYGPVITPESLTSYKAFPKCLLSVGHSGDIVWIVEHVPETLLQDTLAQKGCMDFDVTVLSTGEFLIPGFIDTHTVSYLPFTSFTPPNATY